MTIDSSDYTKLSDLFETITHQITHKKIDKLGIEIPRTKLESSIRLLSWVITINTLLYRILRRFLGDKAAMKVVSILIAPFVEEAAKSVSIRGHFGKIFYIVFNLYESTSYIKKNKRDGVSLRQNLKARIAASLMHLSTTVVHKIFSLKIVQDILNPTDRKDAEDRASFISYTVSTFIHSAWNQATATC